MRQSGMVQRTDAAFRKGLEQGYKVGSSISLTQILDVTLITLHENFGFGQERIGKFFDTFSENWDEFRKMSKEDAPDKAYVKSVIDSKLKEAVPADRFEPWEERYEYDYDPRFNYQKGVWE